MATNETFEESLTKLESIAERIEKGDVGLEESIKLYEEGMKLVARCRHTLKTAETRIEELSRLASQGDAGNAGDQESDSC